MESKINKAVYAITDRNGAFGADIISGIITGVSYTEQHAPRYEITHGSNRTWVTKIADSKAGIIELLQLPELIKVAASNVLNLKLE